MLADLDMSLKVGSDHGDRMRTNSDVMERWHPFLLLALRNCRQILDLLPRTNKICNVHPDGLLNYQRPHVWETSCLIMAMLIALQCAALA